jgi:hypothetical protein
MVKRLEVGRLGGGASDCVSLLVVELRAIVTGCEHGSAEGFAIFVTNRKAFRLRGQSESTSLLVE